jgi:hypothetical protein
MNIPKIILKLVVCILLSDYTEGSFYDKSNPAFNPFHTYHTKMYLQDFKANWGEKIF